MHPASALFALTAIPRSRSGLRGAARVPGLVRGLYRFRHGRKRSKACCIRCTPLQHCLRSRLFLPAVGPPRGGTRAGPRSRPLPFPTMSETLQSLLHKMHLASALFALTAIPRSRSGLRGAALVPGLVRGLYRFRHGRKRSKACCIRCTPLQHCLRSRLFLPAVGPPRGGTRAGSRSRPRIMSSIGCDMP